MNTNNIEYYLQTIESKISKLTLAKIKNDVLSYTHQIVNAMSNVCISRVNVYSSLVSLYSSLTKEFDKEFIDEMVKEAYKDRPVELVQKYVIVKIIIVLSLISISLKDFKFLKDILFLYALIRFYMYFTSKIEYCNSDIMNIAIERLTKKTFVKQFHGSYPKVVSKIVDNFYNKYIIPYHNSSNEKIVSQCVIVIDYIRTRVKHILQTLVKSYYEVYQNKEKYETRFSTKNDFLTLHINQITHRFFTLCKSEKQHPTYSKNMIPDVIAIELVKGYISNSEKTTKIIQLMLSLFDKHITVNVCEKEYANEIRKLYVKKKCQSYFEEIDSFNKEILSKIEIPNNIILKYARYAGKTVVYRIELRSYFIVLLYMSIVQVIC